MSEKAESEKAESTVPQQVSPASPEADGRNAAQAPAQERSAWPPGSRDERRSRSFLVRVWVEPRELEGAAPLVRGSLRDLQSGEESYFTEPGGLGERLLDDFDLS